MRYGRSLIDNPVYNSEDGRTLGRVEGLYLDKDLTSVVAVRLGSEGLIKRTPVFIRARDIALFGVDAVFAKGAATVFRGEEIPAAGQWVRLDDLQGRQVDTPGGTKIGRIGDVVLDAEARVTGISLGQIAVEGPVAENKAFARGAVVDVGQADGSMTIDLATAEREGLTVDPDALTFSSLHVPMAAAPDSF